MRLESSHQILSAIIQKCIAFADKFCILRSSLSIRQKYRNEGQEEQTRSQQIIQVIHYFWKYWKLMLTFDQIHTSAAYPILGHEIGV